MKKLISLFLALTMLLCLCTTALADTTQVTTTRTYNGYKLLNLTTSQICTSTDAAHTHVDGCYSYAYTVNTKYSTILNTVTGATDVIAYFNSLTGDTDSGYGSLRAVADDIYRAILTANMDPDAENITGTADIAQGYWLFADVTDLDDAVDKANSLVVLDTKGQEELTIKTKVGLPTIEKKVKDVNDTTGAETDWQDSADYDISDTVPFQITVTMPENLAGYETYEVIIHDTMSSGLTLLPATIKVYADKVDVTDKFTIPTAAASEFEISCANVMAITGVTKDTEFVVTYDATLNTNAEIGAAGNPNVVYLEYSNDPYSDSTGQTQTDKVTVFTYQVVINKVDADQNPLQGAGFTLYKKNSDGTYTAIGNQLVGGDMTTFSWAGLDDGDYKLEETTVPAGYNKLEDVLFTITAEHDTDSADPKLTALTSSFGVVEMTGTAEIKVPTGYITETVINQTGTVLPETGAKGTMMLIGGGSVLVMLAAIFMITRKKMSVYED